MNDRMFEMDEKGSKDELCDDAAFQGTIKWDDVKADHSANNDGHVASAVLCESSSQEAIADKAGWNEPNLGYMRGIRITSYLGKWPVKLN